MERVCWCMQGAKQQNPAPSLNLPACLTDCGMPPALLTGEVKAELISILTDMVQRHQQARAQVTDAVVDAFMAVRPMAP